MSAQFLASESLLDATLFLTSTTTPSALKMADATRLAATRHDAKDAPVAYDLALHRPRPFRAAFRERSKLGRQWEAYLAHAAGSPSDDELVDIFSRLNWSSLGNACVVEVSQPRLLQTSIFPLSLGNLKYPASADARNRFRSGPSQP